MNRLYLWLIGCAAVFAALADGPTDNLRADWRNPVHTPSANGGVNQRVYFQKDSRPDFYRIGLLDIERSLEDDIKPLPWQTDTCLGHWFYDVRAQYKDHRQVIGLLVDRHVLVNHADTAGAGDSDCQFILCHGVHRR